MEKEGRVGKLGGRGMRREVKLKNKIQRIRISMKIKRGRQKVKKFVKSRIQNGKVLQERDDTKQRDTLVKRKQNKQVERIK